jgi:hypothetical protein
MAEEYQRKQGAPKEVAAIPEEYQRYRKVFSDEEARNFPIDRNLNATIC